MVLTSLIGAMIVIGILAYHHVRLIIWHSLLIALLLLLTIPLHRHGHNFAIVSLWTLYCWLVLPIAITSIRRRWLSQPIFQWFQNKMPTMSRTEKEALEAGTTHWEAELFNGNPHFKNLMNIPVPQLTAEEQAFIDGPVSTLCCMINDWDITHNRTDLSPEIWQFIKENGFFGLIIPKRYGGKAFSAYAHSEILSKLCRLSISVGTTVSVPNSLGPGELLLHYGTEAQKDYYLPRLARGEDIPCFGLTSPVAGSDAGSIPDTGVVCHGLIEGKNVLGIRLNWNKRYITLAPVATVLGLAFRLFDPERLLGGTIDYGITCALIPTDTPGITIGRRHFPLNSAFLNGPTQGKDVFIPMDWIIGGSKMAGCGWRMLMDCLSAGRAISLPSSSIGGAKMAVRTTTAYARVRKQFNLPIGKFEGIVEVLARMAGNLYLIDSGLRLTLAIIDQGGKPSVLSAMIKYHATETCRKIACDAMDVQGGKAICLGPHNYVGRLYQQAPIAVTVEGANILTRCLIIFGQGAIRCHRYVLSELEATKDAKNGLALFDRALFGHMGLVLSNFFRTIWLALTGAKLTKIAQVPKSLKIYYRGLMRFSSAFAFTADIAMSLLGGELKRREQLSARLGDVLSYLYLISATLKRFVDDGAFAEDLPLVHWTCQQQFHLLEQRFTEILQNFPHRGIAALLKIMIFPWGKCWSMPADRLTQQVANLLLSPSATRDRLTFSQSDYPLLAELEDALQKVILAEPIAQKLQQAIREGVLENSLDTHNVCQKAYALNLITAAEKADWLAAEVARLAVINVDDFAYHELARTNQQ